MLLFGSGASCWWNLPPDLPRFGAGWTSDEGHLGLSTRAEQNISGKSIHSWQEIPRYGVLTDPESTKQLQPRLGHFDWHSGLMGQIQLQLGLLEHCTWFSYLMISTGAGCCLLTAASFLWWSARESPCQEEMEYASKGSHLIPSHPFFLSPTRALQSDGIWVPKDSDSTQGLFFPNNKCGCFRTTDGCFRVCHLGIWGFRHVGYPYLL